jgi:multicomponent K+:H+ antiporter subunit E
LGTALAAATAPSSTPPRHAPLLVRLLITLRLIAVVLKDIVVANLQVARLILGRQENLSPGFVTVPLRVRDPRAVSCLAAIVTMTPGTVSAELSDDRTWLYVHALDLRDAEALVTLIRERYEQPLLELMP